METSFANNTLTLNKRSARIDFLDYLKAACVVLVIITHYDWLDKHTYTFEALINMAVPVFMILSGYNFAMSYKKKTGGNLLKMYSPKLLLKKLDRFAAPFIVICFVELGLIIYEHKHINLPRIFLYGAYGPGSYYVPLMVQLLCIFPLIYLLIEKAGGWGLVISGVINYYFEVWVVNAGIERDDYRLLLGRYILLVAMGCYLCLHPKKRLENWQLELMLAVGLYYIWWLHGQPHHLKMFRYWTPTALPIDFYIFPVIVVLFRVFYHAHIPGFLGKLVSDTGKASYHIFLVQMVYYHFDLGGPLMTADWRLALPCNLVINIAIGIGFYRLENLVRKECRALLSHVQLSLRPLRDAMLHVMSRAYRRLAPKAHAHS